MRETVIAFEARTSRPFADTVARCREELAREGFGVLTEIDIQAKLKEKLGVALEPYVILGACHAPSAYRALRAVPEVGVLLPCNVTVSRENDETVVRAMNPGLMEQMSNQELRVVASEIGAALRRVVEHATGAVDFTPGGR
ncbi:MAG: DUF302 domain-containing protein [Acidobacteriota bacterium]